MFADSGAARLAYDVTGAGEPAVLLVHAGVTDRRSWERVVDRLAPSHRCVRFDARGFGETTYAAESFAPHEDARAVLDSAGVDRAAVIGASIGGKAAIDLALEHPDRVSALVLIGPAVSGGPSVDEHSPDIAPLVPALDAAEAGRDLAEQNRLDARVWLDGPTAPEGRVVGSPRELFLDMNARALAAPDPGPERPPVDAWARLGQITVPTLVLVGDLDLLDVQRCCAEAVERMPAARLVRLHDVAHLPHLEGDLACLDEISGFLDALPG